MSQMGMATGYEGLFLARLPASDVPAARLADVSVEDLVQEWEVELEAVRRRARLRLVEDGPPSSIAARRRSYPGAPGQLGATG